VKGRFVTSIVSAFIVTLAGCGGRATLYSRGDVDRAFRAQGFALRAQAKFSREGQTLFRPTKGEPFLVLVFKNEGQAREAIANLYVMHSGGTIDLRRRNVVVTSDGGLARRTLRRIQAALAQLAQER
jgi:hypothetical protein